MNKLKDAIWNSFLPGMVKFFYVAPEELNGVDVKPPYCVYQFITEDSDDTFTEQISTVDVQFNVFADKSDDCSNMKTEIDNYYFNNHIVMGERTIKLNKIMGIPSFKVGEIWQATSSFEVII